MNETWIKLHSKFLNWGWYKNKNTKILFIHCLLKANWQDGYFEGIEVKRGSFVTGRKQLSKELGLTEQEIRTSIKHLKSTNEITITSTKNFSIISINNYDKYQVINQQINQRATNEQPQSKNIDINNNYYLNKIEENFGRVLAPLEIDMVESWIKEIDDVRKIDYAISETITNGIRNLKYTNAILENIRGKRYEDLMQISKEEEPEVDIPDFDWLDDER